MQLEDRLKICLLALESRYPEHVIDVNRELLALSGAGDSGWSASEVVEYLERTNATMLTRMARLIIDPQCSEIYLLGQSEPAFVVHCRGKIPSRHEKHALSTNS
ncbi:MAG: hypothetical protein H0U76_16830 [Ktedonobacteraceae bacterium]|nr:hypothetical protein [Ktedonobacteraceae bacterium]